MSYFEDQPNSDEVLEIPVRLMRAVWAWPDESRHPAAAWLSINVICGPLLVLMAANTAYIFSGEYESYLTVLGVVGDVVAVIVVIAKALCLHHHGCELLAIRKCLQDSFERVENMLAPTEARVANYRCIVQTRKFCRWMLFLYIPFSISGIVLNVYNATLPPDQRQLNIKIPAFITRTSYTYWPALLLICVVFYTFPLISGNDSEM
ncbi:uncharacterized protein LOC127751287 [Frankliniella occidentalis]|uniref:Uncharacterized protein LOC127751287 n=1 Tax=Frankliniella occidentalis TaxID=133901 RepID=A0A9C6XU16_FRAOC|nr:uncharacterized protein LOC127751287 [Frankliniella occidentalis]